MENSSLIMPLITRSSTSLTSESVMKTALIDVVKGVELKCFESVDGRTNELAPIAANEEIKLHLDKSAINID